MKLVLALCSFAICGALSLNAADEPKKPESGRSRRSPEERFKKADSNNDGFVTKEELVTAFGKKDASKVAEHFKKLDTNSDGKLSPEEMKARSGGKRRKAK
jgi:Ca2+-binding EF-hand superfamily protein